MNAVVRRRKTRKSYNLSSKKSIKSQEGLLNSLQAISMFRRALDLEIESITVEPKTDWIYLTPGV